MIVVVTGSRHMADLEFMRSCLSRVANADGDVRLFHGAANGADFLANHVATEKGWLVDRFAANWKRDGKAAGPRRNKTMIDAAIKTGERVVCLAFPAIDSRGTKHCMAYAIEQSIPTFEFQLASRQLSR